MTICLVQEGMGAEETIYGYVRIPSQEQNKARQLTTMRALGVPEENIVVEKLSGKDFHRPRTASRCGPCGPKLC